MFGYILPCVGELKVRDNNFYEAAYCGICKSIGTNTGLLPRFVLSYDSVFFALTLMLPGQMGYETAYEGCIANPVKKRGVIRKSVAIDYIADVNVLTAYFKLLDDAYDENSLKGRVSAKLLSPAVKKIKSRRGQLYEVIEEGVNKLRESEKAGCDILDMAAEPFSDMMSKTMRLGGQAMAAGGGVADQAVDGILEAMGYNIGKWLYFADAFDDMEKDYSKGCYNAVLRQYQFGGANGGANGASNTVTNGVAEDFDGFRDRIRGNFGFVMTYTLGKLSENLEKLMAYSIDTDNPIKNIVENIVYIGLSRRTEIILSGGKNKDQNEKRDGRPNRSHIWSGM
jgi:hypothetical protein